MSQDLSNRAASQPLMVTSPHGNPKRTSKVTESASPGTDPTQATRRRNREGVLRRLWLSIVRICRLRSSEQPKIVVKQSWGRALLRCSVHFVPIAVTITLACLNLQGYFIGGSLAGSTDDTAQTIYRLCLQVLAKFMEIFTVSSLANIILTIVRRELVFDAGLPLGLLYSNTRFTQITYLFSPAFWSCAKFPGSWKKRGFLIASVLVAGILAVFAGPASALLLLPEVRTAWPAGGTKFWLVGNAKDLWPSHLGPDNIGGQDCATPNEDAIRFAPINTTKCIWHYSTGISEAFKTLIYQYNARWAIDDGLGRRNALAIWEYAFDQHYFETWTLLPYAALVRHSIALKSRWWNSAYWTTNPQYARIKYGTRGQGASMVESLIPAVRAACSQFYNFDFERVVNDKQGISFPYLPEYAYWAGREAIYLPIPRYHNSSRISAQWVPAIDGQALLVNNTKPDHYSSAYLLIYFPSKAGLGTAFSCAIDAKWGPGSNRLNGIGKDGEYADAELTNLRPRNESVLGAEYGFLPIDDGSWTTVSASQEWLDTLTPSADKSLSGFTTISSALQGMGGDNNFKNYDWQTARIATASLLATTVADGMSRIGLERNLGFLTWKKDDIDKEFLSDGNAVLPPGGKDPSDPNLTPLHWTVTVSGYAYKADQVAHFLSLAVLFIHLLLAVAHIIYVLFTRTAPVAWGTSEELLVLSQNSPPAEDALENTCGGIQCRKTFRKVVRIRALNKEREMEDNGTLHMVFEEDYDSTLYEGVEVGKAYGSG